MPLSGGRGRKDGMAKLREINGVKKTLTDWCVEYGINRGTVSDRLHRGIPLLEALTMPVDDRYARKHTRTREEMWKVCAKCQWSQEADGHPACFWIDYPGHGRRPVSAEECTARGKGSVFEPRKKGKWTPAQEMAFTSRGV